MRFFLIIIILLSTMAPANSQKIINIPYDYHCDSSYYAATLVSENAWWVSGENGVIKEVDRNGKIKDLPINLNGNDVFKMDANEKNIYIIGQGPSLNIIEKTTNLIQSFDFSKEFKNSCFYDLVVLSNNNIILCGGNHKIAHAQKTLPYGFIAIFNPETKEKKIKTIKKSPFHFYFSITQSPKNGKLYASNFNGYRSIIYQSEDGTKWEKYKSIKGIIHDLMIDKNDHLWFLGTTSMNYRKTGMIGRIADDNVARIETEIGCLWRAIEINDEIIASSVQGDLFIVNASNMEYKIEKTGFSKPVYCISINNNQEILLGGHGKSIKIRLPESYQSLDFSSTRN